MFRFSGRLTEFLHSLGRLRSFRCGCARSSLPALLVNRTLPVTLHAARPPRIRPRNAGGPCLYAQHESADDGKDADYLHPARTVTGWPAPRRG